MGPRHRGLRSLPAASRLPLSSGRHPGDVSAGLGPGAGGAGGAERRLRGPGAARFARW